MTEALFAAPILAAFAFFAALAFNAWRRRRASERARRQWLEAYAHELGITPLQGESTPALRRRLAAHLTEPPWRSR